MTAPPAGLIPFSRPWFDEREAHPLLTPADVDRVVDAVRETGRAE